MSLLPSTQRFFDNVTLFNVRCLCLHASNQKGTNNKFQATWVWLILLNSFSPTCKCYWIFVRLIVLADRLRQKRDKPNGIFFNCACVSIIQMFLRKTLIDPFVMSGSFALSSVSNDWLKTRFRGTIWGYVVSCKNV